MPVRSPAGSTVSSSGNGRTSAKDGISEFVFTPTAEADLTEIITFIAQESPDAAGAVRRKLWAAFSQLAAMPGMGHFREDLLDRRHKFWSVHSYVIVYRWKTKPIEIIAIVHGARDLDAFLPTRGGRGPGAKSE